MIIQLAIIITIGVTIISLAGIINDHSEKRMKIEAALREEEMRRGYIPGTYSRSFSSKKAYKEMKKQNKRAYKHGQDCNTFRMPKEDNEYPMDREELEKAIGDLEKRINNLDTIMRDKRDGR